MRSMYLPKIMKRLIWPTYDQYELTSSRLLNNATHSDMILRLRSPASTTSLNSEDNVDTSSTFTFYAHLAICSMHTEYFSNAVKHGFREAENSGKATFNFEEYDAEALLWVIKYMYVGDYDVDVDPYEELVLLSNLRDSGSSPHEDEHWQGPLVHPHLGPILIAHARVHRLADMLLMDRLKRLAEYRFNQWIDQTIDLTSPEDNLDYLLELIGQLWINDTNTANLKKAVMRLILSLTSSRSDNIRELLARDDYRTLMRETDLGWEFAEELLNERLMDSLYQ